MEDKSKKLTAVKRNKLMKVANLCSVAFAFAFIGALMCICFPNKYIVPFIVCAVLSVATFVVVITLNVIAGKPGKYLAEKWAHYAKLPKVENIDFKGELETVRKNYEEDTYEYKNRIENFKIEGSKDMYDFSVLKSGKIVYGYVVEANTAIFSYKRGGMRVSPAVVVYGTDEYFETHPYALAKTAEELYANRQTNILANERNYFTGTKIKNPDGKELYVSALFLYRPYLPTGYLRGSLIPVIADSAKNSSVFAVDADYWTENLIANFVNGDSAYGEEEAQKELGN